MKAKHRSIRNGLACGIVALAGCRAVPCACDRATVSHDVSARTGYDVNLPAEINRVIVPAEVEEGRPLSEDHAVLTALWNNALFQELLVDLRLTKADLIQAGLLPNPEFVYSFQVSDKPFKYLFDLPVEAIWLRPVRLKAAEAENQRACARLAQAALDLIRDTRQAYADVILAKDRIEVARQSVVLRSRVAALAESRLKAGDANVQEITPARVDALQAKQDEARVGFELPLAEERLRNLLGLGDITEPLLLEEPIPVIHAELIVATLVSDAIASRPDAVAAEIAVRAAEARLAFAKIGWVRFLGILDATSGQNGHEFGPAFRVTLPLFNRNQGVVARAEAEVEQLCRRRLTVRNQIILDVKLAHTRLRQARTELALLTGTVRPEVEAGIVRSEKAFRAGNASYLIVLETTRQLIDSYGREAQLRAELRRAWADLERSVGKRLAPAKDEPS